MKRIWPSSSTHSPWQQRRDGSNEMFIPHMGICEHIYYMPEVKPNWFNSWINICVSVSFLVAAILRRYTIWPAVSSVFAQKHILFDKNVYIPSYSLHIRFAATDFVNQIQHTVQRDEWCCAMNFNYAFPPFRPNRGKRGWYAHPALFTRLTRNENKTVYLIVSRLDCRCGASEDKNICSDYAVVERIFIFCLCICAFIHIHRWHWNDNRLSKMRLQCDWPRMRQGNRLNRCRQVKSMGCLSRNHVKRQQSTQMLYMCSHSRASRVCGIPFDSSQLYCMRFHFQTNRCHLGRLVAFRRVQSTCSRIYFLIGSVRYWNWSCDVVI